MNERPKVTYYIIYDVFVSALGLRSGDLNVYAAIYSAVAHLDGYISISMICRQTGISEPRVCEILKNLEKRGLVTRSAVGYRRKNRYKLNGVTVGAKGFPEMTTPEKRDVANNTDQNYSDKKRSTTTKRLLPKINTYK